MPELATLTFRAKREDGATRWTRNPEGGSTFTEGHTSYRVPKLTSSHVTTPRPQQGTRHTLMFGHSTPDAIRKQRTERLLEAHGLDPYRIYAEDGEDSPHVVITPDKSGFMATITLTLDLCAK
jgi:hypothetical protein